MPIKTTPSDPRKWVGLANVEQMLDQARRTAQAAEARQREVVLIVHGTYANPSRDSTMYGRTAEWWESSGSFTKALDAALERRGAKARCYEPLESRLDMWRREGVGSMWLGWSGDNSEVERRRGAYELANHIRFLQRERDVSRIHIVAHSHGGNVVRRALRYVNDPRWKVGVVVCLGTPFLHFADTGAWRRWLAAVHWPMLIAFAGLAAASGWVMSRPGFNNAYLGYSLTASAAAAGYSLWRYFRTSEGNALEMPALALRFANDEAIQLLRSCAVLTTEPHLYLRDLLGGPAAARELRALRREHRRRDGWFERLSSPFLLTGRLAANAFAVASNIWNGPVCRAAERLTTVAFRVPVAGAICALMLIATMRPYRPRLRPFLSSRIPRLAALFFHSIGEESDRTLDDLASTTPRAFAFSGVEAQEAKPWWVDPLKGTAFDPRTAQTAAALAAALLYVVFYPIDKLLGMPSWLGAVMTRFAILMGVRAAASGAPGMDMLGAAFRPARTSTAPKNITELVIPEAIEHDIEQRLTSNSRIDFAMLRGGIDAAKRASLFATVKLAFTDVGLLHAQYYRDARIVDYIAQCIAGTTPCEWMVDGKVFEVAASAEPAQSPTRSGESTV
jgi:hypothetical protein